MQPSTKLSISVLTLASLASLNLAGAPAPASLSSYTAHVAGDISAFAVGRAYYGSVQMPGGPEAYTVTLGDGASNGSILFTRIGGGPLTPGTYPVTDEGSGVRALVSTGSAEHPTGAFRGESGVLTITGTTNGGLVGEFRIRAAGFLAADPGDEGRRITVSGSFKAAPTGGR